MLPFGGGLSLGVSIRSCNSPFSSKHTCLETLLTGFSPLICASSVSQQFLHIREVSQISSFSLLTWFDFTTKSSDVTGCPLLMMHFCDGVDGCIKNMVAYGWLTLEKAFCDDTPSIYLTRA